MAPRTVVFILGMGRTGSSTIRDVLTQAGIANIRAHATVTEQEFGDPDADLVEMIHSMAARVGVDIILPIRDPLARAISAFFYQLPLYMGWDKKGYQSWRWTDEILDHFLDPHIYPHDSATLWMDEDFQVLTDISWRYAFQPKPYWVYTDKYPHDEGSWRVLMVRCEDLTMWLPTAFAHTYNLRGITVPVPQPMETRPGIRELYRMAINGGFRFDEEWLRDFYWGDEVARTFYTDDELDAFVHKWEAPNHSNWRPPRNE